MKVNITGNSYGPLRGSDGFLWNGDGLMPRSDGLLKQRWKVIEVREKFAKAKVKSNWGKGKVCLSKDEKTPYGIVKGFTKGI